MYRKSASEQAAMVRVSSAPDAAGATAAKRLRKPRPKKLVVARARKGPPPKVVTLSMFNCDLKRSLLFKSVDEFYTNIANFNELQKFLVRPFACQGISLRLLDYFLTVYAGEHGVCMNVNGKMKSFHDIYQARLSINGKIMYDAFRRTEKLTYIKHGQSIETTLGQLVFFKDVIQFKVMDYVLEHLPEVKQAMVNDQAHASEMKKKKIVQKRRSGRRCPGVFVYSKGVTLKFNK